MQLFLYLTANKSSLLLQGLFHNNISRGENYNNGPFRYFWPQAKILAVNRAAFPINVVCKIGERCQKWTESIYVAVVRRVWGLIL